MSVPSVRYNIAAVLVMTVGVVLLVMRVFAWGAGLFALGAVLALLAGRAAAREAGRGRQEPRRIDRDATAEDDEHPKS